MSPLQVIGLVIAAILITTGLLLCSASFLLRWLRDRAARAYLAKHPRPAIYEIGSPEYNAQIVGAIRTLNERIAASGRRVPEKTAIDIIRQASGDQANESGL